MTSIISTETQWNEDDYELTTAIEVYYVIEELISDVDKESTISPVEADWIRDDNDLQIALDVDCIIIKLVQNVDEEIPTTL